MSKKYLVVYVVRGADHERTYWDKVGVAFVNKDGSLNMELHLFPGVRFHLREPKKNEE